MRDKPVHRNEIAAPSRCRSRRRIATAMLAFLVLFSACESTTLRALRGARLYTSGTEALERGEVGVAIRELEDAAVLAPGASEIQNHLGLAYWTQGDHARAVQAFDRAVELDCENDAAVQNRAKLSQALNAGEAGQTETDTIE